ncbi:MAG TPA: hypothetical protein GXX73_14250 [Clostridium sp.]|nr:hypothetical protein [Clostridium sp.]
MQSTKIERNDYMYSSSKRVLEILLLISQSKSQEGYTSKEIFDILSQSQKNFVSIKTVKNDLKKLKKYGFVVYEPITKKNKLNHSLFY